MSIVNVKVANLHSMGYANLKEWMMNPDNLYVGPAAVVVIDGAPFPKQASKWANPYKEGTEYARDEALFLYESDLRERLVDQKEVQELLALEKKNLGCWCAPQQCHAHILQKLIKELSK